MTLGLENAVLYFCIVQDKQAVAYEEMSGSDEEAGDHDAYLEHMKAEGKQRDEEDDDDDSSGISKRNIIFNVTLMFFSV